jgi:hypothetical protein
VVVGAVACLAACTGPVEVESPSLEGSDAATCRTLVDTLPDQVADEERREVDGDFAAAYGDPPIVVRCGVPRPEELMTNCTTVNGVDWYTRETDSGLTVFTVGRQPTVEVRIPADYGTTTGAALVDVAGPVTEHTEILEPCPTSAP